MVGGRQAPVAWMTHFLLGIKSRSSTRRGWWWRGAVGDWRPLEEKQQVRPPPGVKRDASQPTLTERWAHKFLGKEKRK